MECYLLYWKEKVILGYYLTQNLIFKLIILLSIEDLL